MIQLPSVSKRTRASVQAQLVWLWDGGGGGGDDSISLTWQKAEKMGNVITHLAHAGWGARDARYLILLCIIQTFLPKSVRKK